jgi:hypothetical protein
MYESPTIELDRPQTAASDDERVLFAEQFVYAVSLGWEHVIRLLQSREPDPLVREEMDQLLAA